jgi:(2Fe-2S) ferredoxin
MAPPFQRHVFVCTNRRPDGHPKGCCASKGSEELRAAFKAELEKRGIKGKMRANAAGCLDTCAFGPSVVVYPEGVWYGGVKVEDVPAIVEEHLIGGRPVERLLMKFQKKEPKQDGAQPAEAAKAGG